jgi:glycosyltransferase involved in cell wall biosynthesis
MFISIVIPTRERAETLRYALAACARIDDSQIEIVVSDNASLDDTAAVVAAQRDARIRYVRTPQRCSMRENFEFAVSQTRGDYVFVMGDDDALIPNQFPYLRALLEAFQPDSMTGTAVKYTWPGAWRRPSALATVRRVKLLWRSVYGKPRIITGAQLRADLVANGAKIKWAAPRIYGGVLSRRVIEALKAKSGQLFMGSWPDIYTVFAAPSVIERHLVVNHPFFIGASSPKGNGVNFLEMMSATTKQGEYRRFMVESKLDPLVDPIPDAPSIQIGEFSLLEAANRRVYDGRLAIDYEREFDRALKSMREVEDSRRPAVLEALARFAAERKMPPQYCEAEQLAVRCEPFSPPPQTPPAIKTRDYVSFDRVVVHLKEPGRGDVDAAAAVCERLLGAGRGGERLPAWIGLLYRALPLLRDGGRALAPV